MLVTFTRSLQRCSTVFNVLFIDRNDPHTIQWIRGFSEYVDPSEIKVFLHFRPGAIFPKCVATDFTSTIFHKG